MVSVAYRNILDSHARGSIESSSLKSAKSELLLMIHD